MAYKLVDLSFVEDLERHRYGSMFHDTLDDWGINDSSIADYTSDMNFAEHGGRRYLYYMLSQMLGDVDGKVAIDIAGGSNGFALQQLIEGGLIEKGLVTNLEDRRNLTTRKNLKLDHVAGDLCEFHTWDKIVAWARANAPQGLDLVMHRPSGALQRFPVLVYGKAVIALLEMLRPGGILFAQVPESLQKNSVGFPETKKLARVCGRIQESGLAAQIIRSTVEYDSDKLGVIIRRS